jgi:hypothetical protein
MSYSPQAQDSKKLGFSCTVHFVVGTRSVGGVQQLVRTVNTADASGSECQHKVSRG